MLFSVSSKWQLSTASVLTFYAIEPNRNLARHNSQPCALACSVRASKTRSAKHSTALCTNHLTFFAQETIALVLRWPPPREILLVIDCSLRTGWHLQTYLHTAASPSPTGLFLSSQSERSSRESILKIRFIQVQFH